MADITQSLFGITPEAYQQAQNQGLQAEALKFASLDPMQQAQMGAYMAGSRLGTGIGGLLGAEDPQLQRIKQRQQLLQGGDFTSVEGLKALASKAYQAGDYPGAQELLNRASKLEADSAEASKKRADADKAVFDVSPQGRAQELAKTGKFTSESIDNYVAGKGQLVSIDKFAKPSGDFIAKAVQLKFGEHARYGDYTPEQTAAINSALQQDKIGLAHASAQKPVDVAAIIKEIGTTQDIKGKAETWKQAGAAYTAQVPMLNKLDEVVASLPKSYTGSLAGASLQFGKALSAIGIPVDEKKLSNTEYVNSISAQVLQTIARSFPGSLAVKEMEQLVKSKFNAQQQLETMTRIIRDLRTEIQSGVLSYEQLSRLPEQERYNKDMNLLTGTNYKKLSRLNTLMDKSLNKTITKTEIEEAQKLQQELK